MPEKILQDSAGLSGFVPIGLPGKDRPRLWPRLVGHWRDLCFHLDRDPGLRVALLDLVALEDRIPALRGAVFLEAEDFHRRSEGRIGDAAVGLHSEGLFRRMMEREAARCRRHPEPASILYLEPAHSARDTRSGSTGIFGPSPAGIGSRLAAAARGSDLPARIGADAAAVLLTGSGRRGVDAFFERLVRGARPARQAAIRVRASVIEIPNSGGGDPLDRVRDEASMGRTATMCLMEDDPAVVEPASITVPPAEGPEGRPPALVDGLAEPVRDHAAAWARWNGMLRPDPEGNAAALFRLLAGIDLGQEEAVSHWEGINRHAEALRARLGRTVDPRTASLDYLLNLNGLLHQPVLLPSGAVRRPGPFEGVDPLTRCETWTGMEWALRAEFRRAWRTGAGFCLARFDADRFGAWTSRHGEGAAHRLLRMTSNRLGGRVRRSDVIARTGGDDFFLLLPHSGRDGALRAAERLRAELGNRLPGCPPGPTWRVGVAAFGSDSARLAGLVVAAVAAADQARRAGGDRVAAGSPSQPPGSGV